MFQMNKEFKKKIGVSESNDEKEVIYKAVYDATKDFLIDSIEPFQLRNIISSEIYNLGCKVAKAVAYSITEEDEE